MKMPDLTISVDSEQAYILACYITHWEQILKEVFQVQSLVEDKIDQLHSGNLTEITVKVERSDFICSFDLKLYEDLKKLREWILEKIVKIGVRNQIIRKLRASGENVLLTEIATRNELISRASSYQHIVNYLNSEVFSLWRILVNDEYKTFCFPFQDNEKCCNNIYTITRMYNTTFVSCKESVILSSFIYYFGVTIYRALMLEDLEKGKFESKYYIYNPVFNNEFPDYTIEWNSRVLKIAREVKRFIENLSAQNTKLYRQPMSPQKLEELKQKRTELLSSEKATKLVRFSNKTFEFFPADYSKWLFFPLVTKKEKEMLNLSYELNNENISSHFSMDGTKETIRVIFS